MRLRILLDGSSHGNPGPSGIGIIILNEDGKELARIREYVGIRTNNEAEYLALIRAIELAIELGAEEVELFSDSKLLVKQVSGEYRVRDEGLGKLHGKVLELMERIRARLIHVGREENEEADRLANQAAKSGGRS